MKLKKKDVLKISNVFNLNKIKKFSLIKDGLKNFNYEFITENETYIIRILSEKITHRKKKHLELEFKVINFLIERKFPYQIPVPIKNKYGRIISVINGKKYWVYKKIEGNKLKNINNAQFIKLIKLTAIYCKFLSDFDVNNYKEKINYNWLFLKYDELKKIKPKNSVDLLMIKNIYFFEKILKNYANFKIPGKNIAVHADISHGNVLFKENKIIALLDFDNLLVRPKIYDLATVIERTCFDKETFKLNLKKFNLALKEYEKIIFLSKKEKQSIIFILLIGFCISFWWFYSEMKKKPEMKKKILENIIKKTNYVLEINYTQF